jgi:enoyl-[acyl-carrier-protein] reductase (NADH)
MGVAKKEVEEFGNALRQLGVKVQFYNVNAADDEKRKEVLDSIKEHFAGEKSPTLRVLIHSLAFGSIRPLFAESRDKMAGRKQLEMTMDVMANSLIYWTQDLFLDGLLAQNSRIFALTSIGSSRSMINYGAVSAAKAAIEAYIRQVAVELAPYKITANAILAGLTDTPAARKIPGFYEMLAHAKQHNPFNRNTVPTDVAKAISMLADEDFYWITGQVIGVDGGENILNFMG